MSTPKKPLRELPWRIALLVLLNTVVFFGIYAYFVMRQGVNWLFWVYFGLLLVFGVGYVLYNRAFADASASMFNLPADWSEERKRAFLDARDTRKRKSKWMLVFLFPLAITLMFDIIYLFFGDTLIHLFDSVGKGLGIW